MKSFIVLLYSSILLLSIGCTSKIQEDGKQKSDSLKTITKLEKFLGKKGELYVKEFYDVGSIESNYKIYAKINISAVILYNPGEEEKRLKGLKIEIRGKKYSGYSSYDDEATVFLDMDELQGLVSSIDYMTDLIKKWETEQKEYTEVIFETTGNFQVGFFMKENTSKTDDLYGFAQAGYSKISCYFQPKVTDKLLELKSKIKQGIAVLNSK